MKYVIGFDYGLKNIGIAIGQSITQTATELKPLNAKDGIPNWDTIENLLKEWDIDVAVVGLPINMDGTDSELAVRSKKFANRLHGRFGIVVHLMDERLSTREAKEEAGNRGHKGHYKSDPIDSIAARLILESWLNTQAKVDAQEK